AWTDYAISVRESLKSDYADQPPRAEGQGWVYVYMREGQEEEAYTNVGLRKCLDDRIPVGVLRQLGRSPTVYAIMGLGALREEHDGAFTIVGPATLPG